MLPNKLGSKLVVASKNLFNCETELSEFSMKMLLKQDKKTWFHLHIVHSINLINYYLFHICFVAVLDKTRKESPTITLPIVGLIYEFSNQIIVHKINFSYF
jgi:hypothetical protein